MIKYDIMHTTKTKGISGMMRQKQAGGSKGMDKAEMDSLQKRKSKSKVKGRKGKSSQASDRTKQATTSTTQSTTADLRKSRVSNAASARPSTIERPSQVEKNSGLKMHKTLSMYLSKNNK